MTRRLATKEVIVNENEKVLDYLLNQINSKQGELVGFGDIVNKQRVTIEEDRSILAKIEADIAGKQDVLKKTLDLIAIEKKKLLEDEDSFKNKRVEMEKALKCLQKEKEKIAQENAQEVETLELQKLNLTTSINGSEERLKALDSMVSVTEQGLNTMAKEKLALENSFLALSKQVEEKQTSLLRLEKDLEKKVGLEAEIVKLTADVAAFKQELQKIRDEKAKEFDYMAIRKKKIEEAQAEIDKATGKNQKILEAIEIKLNRKKREDEDKLVNSYLTNI